MVEAFVLIKTESGRTREVFDALSKNLKTKHKHLVFGAYDIVLKVRTRTTDDLIGIVNTKIKSNPGVKATLVLQCWEESPEEAA